MRKKNALHKAVYAPGPDAPIWFSELTKAQGRHAQKFSKYICEERK